MTEIFRLLETSDVIAKRYSYGTAGFRDRYNVSMHSLFVRVGYIALLRSISIGGQCVGVMVTASHNPEDDNGVKIVDPDGNMLDPSWEPFCEEIANSQNENIENLINAKLSSLNLNGALEASVMIGMDTRAHSVKLVECVTQGVSKLSQYLKMSKNVNVDGVRIYSLGEVTTPQLHYGVWLQNQSCIPFSIENVLSSYEKMLLEGYQAVTKPEHQQSNKKKKIVVDCAYGVGSVAMDRILDFLAKQGGSFGQWTFELRNRNKEGPVNFKCGAEHVQKLQQPPINFHDQEDQDTLLCSLDGDADRVVFHTFQSENNGNIRWRLLDGDRIAILITLYIQELLTVARISADELSVGLVQTAYANGASMIYLKNLSGIHALTAKTGVKYVHAVAHHQDIGIYFEANGHGTVLFSEKARVLLESRLQNGENAEVKSAASKLLGCMKLINQRVGDAISDMLMCLAVLEAKGWEVIDWLNLYQDLPSKQMKVVVPNKNIFQCSDDEFYLIQPKALQDQLDVAMKERTFGRCFVRPSGTEDVVRIYAEASTTEEANSLCSFAESAILEYCRQG